jgi:hypothetical protein
VIHIYDGTVQEAGLTAAAAAKDGGASESDIHLVAGQAAALALVAKGGSIDDAVQIATNMAEKAGASAADAASIGNKAAAEVIHNAQAIEHMHAMKHDYLMHEAKSAFKVVAALSGGADLDLMSKRELEAAAHGMNPKIFEKVAWNEAEMIDCDSWMAFLEETYTHKELHGKGWGGVWLHKLTFTLLQCIDEARAELNIEQGMLTCM